MAGATAKSDNDPFVFPDGVEIGVGFSNETILYASLIGFACLTAVVYFAIVTRTKTRTELEDDDDQATKGFEERLVESDVLQLNRAQRRARAHYLMKQQRRQQQANGNPADNDPQPNQQAQHPGDEGTTSLGPVLSRKERQKVAKAVEKAERQLYQEERQKQQEEIQRRAAEERRKKVEETARRLAAEKKQLEIERQRRKEREERDYNTFLSCPQRSLLVEEWLEGLTNSRWVSLDAVAADFQTSARAVSDRIELLIRQGRVAGILERNRFIYLSEEELLSLAQTIEAKGAVDFTDIAQICNNLITA